VDNRGFGKNRKKQKGDSVKMETNRKEDSIKCERTESRGSADTNKEPIKKASLDGQRDGVVKSFDKNRK